jgi:hypothetical protein
MAKWVDILDGAVITEPTAWPHYVLAVARLSWP